MAIEALIGSSDDAGFIAALNSLFRGLVLAHEPAEFWVIQIDNWFDEKWLRFSGLGVVKFSAFGNLMDSALDEFHQDQLTFPAFSPNRVLGQWSYARNSQSYDEAPLPALPHATEKRRSNMNLHRRVRDFSKSACFVWYSSNTRANGKGSVMVYRTDGQKVESWFAAFNRHDGWQLDRTKGIDRDRVATLLMPST